ncbi:MAG: hypothetical protein ACRETL_02125, partial [Gammaproteobacteria bacterium]
TEDVVVALAALAVFLAGAGVAAGLSAAGKDAPARSATAINSETVFFMGGMVVGDLAEVAAIKVFVCWP